MQSPFLICSHSHLTPCLSSMAPIRTLSSIRSTRSFALPQHYPSPYQMRFGDEGSVCVVSTPFQDRYPQDVEVVPPGPPPLSITSNEAMLLNTLCAPNSEHSPGETGLIPAPGIHPGREDRPNCYSLPKSLTSLGWTEELYAKFKVCVFS